MWRVSKGCRTWRHFGPSHAGRRASGSTRLIGHTTRCACLRLVQSSDRGWPGVGSQKRCLSEEGLWVQAGLCERLRAAPARRHQISSTCGGGLRARPAQHEQHEQHVATIEQLLAILLRSLGALTSDDGWRLAEADGGWRMAKACGGRRVLDGESGWWHGGTGTGRRSRSVL